MRLTVELHKALFGKDKIKLNQWELEFLTKLWVSYLNVGKFDKVTYKQKEVLKKIIKKYRSKKERLAQQRTKWGAVERESWLLQQWENNRKVQISFDVWWVELFRSFFVFIFNFALINSKTNKYIWKKLKNKFITKFKYWY